MGGYVVAPMGEDQVIELTGLAAELWDRLSQGGHTADALAQGLAADEVGAALTTMAQSGLVSTR